MSDIVWNTISSDRDIEVLLDEYCGFHDSCICGAEYISGAKVDKNGSMHYNKDTTTKLKLILQSQMVIKTLELQFIGLRQINLIAYQENYFCDISSCYLSFYKGLIVWADCDYFDPESHIEYKLLDEPMITFVVANQLQWRIVDEDETN